MANEAASVAADEAPPTATDPSLPDPPQLTKSDSAQKAIKEPAKPQTPIASVDPSKGILLNQRFKLKMIIINTPSPPQQRTCRCPCYSSSPFIFTFGLKYLHQV